MAVEMALVSAVLSSVASAGRILESITNVAKQRGRSLTPVEFQDIVARERSIAAQRVADGAYASDPLAKNMTGPVVETIRNKMDSIVVDLGKIYTDPTLTPEQQTRRRLEAQKMICFHIMEIRGLSGNVLPADLEQEWVSNNCASFSFP